MKTHPHGLVDNVLSTIPEMAAKQLEAHGAFFVSAAAEVHHRVAPYGTLPDDILKEVDLLEGLAL